MARKTLSILLALCMVLSLMPFGAFAAKNDADTYELTDELVAGAHYIIVNKNDGDGYALKNNDGAPAAVAVTVANGVLTTDDASLVWTAEANGQYFNLQNAGKYIERQSSGSGWYAQPVLAVTDTLTYPDRGWGYSDQQLQHLGGSSAYTLRYSGSNSNFVVQSNSTDKVYLFVKQGDIVPCAHEILIDVDAKAPSCTEAGYEAYWECADCGKLFSDAAGENLIPEPVAVPALGHNWGEWVVTTPAGDTTPGEETRTCTRCDATETREIEPLNAPTYEQADRLVAGVQYLIVSTNEDGTAYVLTNNNAAIGSKEVTIANGKIKVVAPEALWTATANGERFDLTNEGAFLEGKSGNLGIFATQQYPSRNWTYTNSFLEFVGGSYTYELYYENGFTARSFNTGSAEHPVYLFALEGAVQPCQHEDVERVGAVAATCTEDGYSGDLVCTACGEEFEHGSVIPALGHDWSEWTVTTPAGDYTPGEETRTCSRCDAAETREIEPLHVPTYVQVDRLVDGVEYLIVSTNQDGTAYVLTNTGASSGGTAMSATEVTIADGKITGYRDGTLWLATANGERFDLTNEGGYLEGKSGNIKIYSTQQYPNRAWAYSDAYLEHLGGNYTYEVYHNGTSFTYAQYSAGTAPSHPVYLFALEGAVLPCQHENLTEHAAKAATCTENGNDAYWECDDCHKLFSDAAAQTEIEEPVVYAALGHNWGDWTLVTAAGATTPGSEKRVCSRCGEEETRATDPTGVLEPGTYVIVIGGNAVTTVRSANSAQGGTAEYQYTGMDGVPYVDGETEVTAAMIWTVEAVDGGYVIRSGENYLNGTYVGTVGDLAVSDQSDVWTIDSTRLKSTNASAGNSGKFLGYVINKDLFTMRSYRPESPDANLQMDVVFYPVEAFVCDHASTETRGAVEATCTEDGFTGDVYCSVCGEKLADGEAIPALGHSWDEGVVTQRPTGAAAGVKTFTCTRCGETRTESIPKLVNPFVDVAAGKFYFEPVLWAFYSDPQVTSGVDATHFEPDRTCTRAHVVTFLWRANGCPEPQSLTSNFKDVKNTSKYYYKAVLWAAEQGITTGYNDGTFRPDDECTRGQVVTFLWRANGSPAPTSTTNPFSDVVNGKYYTTAVLWAVEQGITQGRTSTTFGPDDSCTRGHVVTFLYRAYAD